MSKSFFETAYDLTGRVAIVTGGAAGIGLSIAQALAERGATLCLIDKAETVEAVAAALPGAGPAECRPAGRHRRADRENLRQDRHSRQQRRNRQAGQG
jgi:NAD(P)-dependent dehydrogenase (short-subunit alcohol dehydrogenase family)